ncbi:MULTISPECIES: YaaA family protein [Trueperella]|uniref:Peroxide stress protein YaaA n=1 Tax=Trueperella bernardiae TaxID=59561 RepID=A0A0W1KLJ6_9ACTO|nr:MULTISPECIES: peroxide stress protein YaaA [Trueperella]KTF04874.1 hypothetical protein AQZ59_00177 [Trueperella bernardiae]MCM3906476.1 peroxide stress protein YaaA [Trueperella bernardiae]MDK8602281.1 peroxide stress protein YaaA [Trueperella bernardiae]OFS76339.1 hypothetical protein HMPREF3167_01215 [Trueperella sp. HMSC08B05]PKZ89859.1 peroxide stress protein YaaA [Trueperella bernardiae]
MLIALPPSAGKTTPATGPALDLASLTAPQLNPVRERVIDALQRVSGAPDALSVLKVGASLEPEIRAQIDFYRRPCAPAWQVYTGVLYAAAGFDTLTDAERERSARMVRIFSGAFGVLSPEDLIPAYRLSMNTKLPDFSVQALWRQALREQAVLPEDELVVDARSGEYMVWSPAPERHVTVGAVRLRNGKRSVVSHWAKHYRGLLAGYLVREANAPSTPLELAEFAQVLVQDGHVSGVELTPAGRGPAKLTLVTEE